MGKFGWLYCFLSGSTSPALVIAVEYKSVANVLFIFASMPIFSFILSSIFLKKRISFRVLNTILVVVMGLSVILHGLRTVDISGWRGDIWALFVSLALASAPTIVHHLKHIPWYPLYRSHILALPLPLLFFINPLIGFEANNIYYLCHVSCIALGICSLALGARYLSTPEVSLLILLESVLAPLLVWVVIGESPYA